MQPKKILLEWLDKNASSAHYLFTLQDLSPFFPGSSPHALKTLLSRMVNHGLERICRDLYAYKSAEFSHGRLLYHAAAHLRAHAFNYLSVESVLSDAGIISQIPTHTIFIMSSGRSSKISCGKFGMIEYIHTQQKPSQLTDHLVYDNECRLWRADIKLALRDMKKTQRNQDLINWDKVHEFI